MGFSNQSSRIIFLIVISQFAGTSLWFSGNAILPSLIPYLDSGEQAIGHLTSAVQFGFISGTLFSAIFTIADRFSPSKVFFISALSGALFNLATLLFYESFSLLLVLRFLTGICLAGIYPVGMKIAADWHKEGLGKALGFLVGALVLGTGFPHFLRFIGGALPWQFVMAFTSGFAAAGGSLIYFFVSDGPYRKRSHGFNPGALKKIFSIKDFRSAAFGYFGHMWELYTFWAFIPVILSTYQMLNEGITFNIPLLSFIIIAIGGPSCVLGGFLAEKAGSPKVAFWSLSLSGILCLISPFLFFLPIYAFLGLLIIWGMMVVADSPQFSVMVAKTAPQNSVGTALTMVNSIGFLITIPSIQILNLFLDFIPETNYYLLLVPGPFIGLILFYRLYKKKS